MEQNELIRIGKLSRAHGIKGEIRGLIEPELLQRIKKLNTLFMLVKGNPLPYFIEYFDLADSGVCLFKFEEVNDRSEAEKLSGKEIFTEEKNLKKKIKETGYSFLSGYKLVDEKEEEVGVIENIFELPAHALAQVFINQKEILIPITEDSVIKIDKRKKEVTLHIPDGLLAIYLK